MFTWLENLIRNTTPEVKSLITIALWLVAMFFIAKPAISAMRAIGDKKWGEALSYIAACVGVVIVAVIATVGLLNAGKNTGDNINSQANMIYALPVVASLVTFKLSTIKSKEM